MKKTDLLLLVIPALLMLASCATYQVSRYYPQIEETSTKLDFSVQIDESSLEWALCRSVMVSDISYFTEYENDKTTYSEPIEYPLSGIPIFVSHKWDKLPLGMQEKVKTIEYRGYRNLKTGYDKDNRWYGNNESYFYQKDLTREKVYEYVASDIQDLKDIINKGLSPILVESDNEADMGKILLALDMGDTYDQFPDAEYTSQIYTAASMLLSTMTLGVSNLIGIPVGTLRSNITMNASLYDKSGKLIKTYSVNADGFGKVGLYYGLTESHKLQGIYADAVKNAVIELVAEIKEDYKL